MDVRQLIGKQFRYKGKYGLSDWTDTYLKKETNITNLMIVYLMIKIC